LVCLFAFVFAFASTACTSPATQVTIVLGSDAPLDRALHIEASVSLAGSAQPTMHTWISGGAHPQVALPASFAIVPAPGDVGSQRVRLDLDAALDAGASGEPSIRFRRTARFRFTRGQSTVVRIFLPVSCGALASDCTMASGADCTVSQRCAEQGQTCGDAGGCVDAMVDPVLPDGGDDLVCAAPPANAAPVVVVPEASTVPLATAMSVGFATAAGLSVITPGANGTASAIEIDASSGASAVVEHGAVRAYLDGTAEYRPEGPNAIEFYVRIPAGSAIAGGADGPITEIASWHWRPGDPFVGANGSQLPLQHSAMHNFARIRFDASATERWLRVVLTADAFRQRYAYYHYFASQGGSGDLAFVPSIRALSVTPAAARTGPPGFDIDDLRLVTLPETARVCPSFVGLDVAAADRDVPLPVEIVNPSDHARTYRVFVSSVVGADRASAEAAQHATGDEMAATFLATQIGSDGGIFVAELFAADDHGNPTGPSIVRAAGAGITIAAHARWRGVLVHHVKASMLAAPMAFSYGSYTASVRRDTLETSLIVWDPNEPPASDPGVLFAASNADTLHSAVFLPMQVTSLPTGWRSDDLRGDQASGHFVSVIHLVP
jgi:hypothetical protein